MHPLWYLWIFVSYYNITSYSYTYIFQGGGQQLGDHLSRYHMSLFFSSNLHAERVSTPLLPTLLMFTTTSNMDWTPSDFRKQFRSTKA